MSSALARINRDPHGDQASAPDLDSSPTPATIRPSLVGCERPVANPRRRRLPSGLACPAFGRTTWAGIGERHSIFRQPLLDVHPRRANELPSRESLVVSHLVQHELRDDQGIGFSRRVELCFSQSQALKRAFKDVDAKGRYAVANLAEHPSRELSK